MASNRAFTGCKCLRLTVFPSLTKPHPASLGGSSSTSSSAIISRLQHDILPPDLASVTDYSQDFRSARARTSYFTDQDREGFLPDEVITASESWTRIDDFPFVWYTVPNDARNCDLITHHTLDDIKNWLVEGDHKTTVLYLLCDNYHCHLEGAGSHGNAAADLPLTPKIMLRRLIAQLLRQRPSLATQSLQQLSEDHFCYARSFDDLWTVFAQLVDIFLVGDRERMIALYIDHLEAATTDGNESFESMLLPRLLNMSGRGEQTGMYGSTREIDRGTMHVEVTSVQRAPERFAWNRRRLREFYVGT